MMAKQPPKSILWDQFINPFLTNVVSARSARDPKESCMSMLGSVWQSWADSDMEEK